MADHGSGGAGLNDARRPNAQHQEGRVIEARVLEALRANDFFAQMTDDDAREFIDACEALTVLPGQALWSPGEVKDAAYILVSGRVEITFRVQPDGQREDQYSRPGSLLTLSSLVHPWEHESAGMPLERSRLLRLSRDAFLKLFEAGRPSAFYLIDAIADDLVDEMRDANRRLHEVFGHPAETLRMLRRRSRGASGG
jgi:CRP-like cAMP-binding protein